MAITGDVTGLTTTDLCEAMQVLHKGKKKVYVDIGDGVLRLVETIRADEVGGESVVVLRALL
jgi:hypothetical protein